MPKVLPPPFLFHFALPVPYVTGVPRRGRGLLRLSADCRLTDLGTLGETSSPAELSAAWNEDGIGFSLYYKRPPAARVPKANQPRAKSAKEGRGLTSETCKSMPFDCDVDSPSESDGLQLWIDTRNTQSIHRATRFCHHFCILPTGGGPKRDQPIALEQPIARSREESQLADPAQLPVSLDMLKSGYRLEVWLPADALTGFDPVANPRLGFYFSVRDAEWGEQFLTVGREFPFSHDPSLWSTLELVR